MTRVDFVIIAETLRRCRTLMTETAFDCMVGQFSDRLKRTNPGFKPALFRRACYSSEAQL